MWLKCWPTDRLRPGDEKAKSFIRLAVSVELRFIRVA